MANLSLIEDTLGRLESERAEKVSGKTRTWLDPLLADARMSVGDLRLAAERIASLAERLGKVGEKTTVTDGANPTPAAPRRAQVLVVDDDESVARTLARVLRGHDVVVALHAPDALERISSGERFDVIVCDFMMPVMTGAQFYEKLKVLAPEQAARMVYITGGTTTAHDSRFLANVGLPILPKPFAPNELRALVQQYLR